MLLMACQMVRNNFQMQRLVIVASRNSPREFAQGLRHRRKLKLMHTRRQATPTIAIGVQNVCEAVDGTCDTCLEMPLAILFRC